MFSFPRTKRLLRQAEFHAIRRQGEEYAGRYLRVCILPATSHKLGLTVSRRFGNSVVRNRFKRLVREAYRLSLPDWPPCHIVVFPRHAGLNLSLSELLTDLQELVLNGLCCLQTP